MVHPKNIETKRSEIQERHMKKIWKTGKTIIKQVKYENMLIYDYLSEGSLNGKHISEEYCSLDWVDAAKYVVV
jgi:hypothetical protein